MKSQKTKVRILIVIFVVVMADYVYSGILPFFAKSHSAPIELLFDDKVEAGRYVKGEVHFTTGEILKVKNSLNFIPTGNEHYYLISDEDFTDCVVVRAEKDWLEKFGKDGFSIDGVEMKGVLKKLDTDTIGIGFKRTSIAKEIEGKMQKLEESGFNIQASGYYVDCLSDKYAVYSIMSLIIILVLFIGFMLFINNKIRNSLIVIILALLFIFEVCFIIHISEMIM